MSNAITPSTELPGLRKLSAKEQAQRATAFACLSNQNQPSCTKVIWVGMFFDGTNNNRDRDMADNSHTNVVVLFNTFRNMPENGYYSYYIPGLGTPFPEIGEMNETDDGKSKATGGEARVHYAMIQMYNAIHRAVHNDKLLVLAAEAKTAINSYDYGLKTVWLLNSSKRIAYFKSLEDRLCTAIKGQKPEVKIINLSIFGFSRGSAEARAFCNWLTTCCQESGGSYTFCGIPIRFQFLGIFDTVASVGLADSSPVGNGFADWADGTMRVPEMVERCVHYAAAHEIRKSFPLSTARDGAAYPGNCTEVIYPGAHCDVGGGYSPGDQGKARAGRAHLVSQVPLVNMYLEARKSGVPLMTIQELAKINDQRTADDLQISKLLAERFQEYAKWSKGPPQKTEGVLFAHMRLYWRWRLQVGGKFKQLESYKAANAQDKEDLQASEGDFKKDINGNVAIVVRRSSHSAPLTSVQKAADEEMRSNHTVPPLVHAFFDEHIHDSHASFRLLGPITQDDRNVTLKKIKAKKEAGINLNSLELRALEQDKATPGSFPVMSDADTDDLHSMSDFVTRRAVKIVTTTRREGDGHVRERKVFDKS